MRRSWRSFTSDAKCCSGDGEVRKPVVTAITKSAMPKMFQTNTRSAFWRGARIGERDDGRQNAHEHVAEAGRPGEQAWEPPGR